MVSTVVYSTHHFIFCVCLLQTTLPEKAAVAIPDTPMVGVTQSGDKLVSFHLIEDDKLKKALSPHRDPQNGTKKDTPNERYVAMIS